MKRESVREHEVRKVLLGRETRQKTVRREETDEKIKTKQGGNKIRFVLE